MTQEARRRLVHELLEKGTDQKLLKGQSDRALELLRRAREEALGPPPLPTPWPEITAYRLAHALLREGRRLEEAEELLREAGGQDALGPLPWIYRLAVLHRLNRPTEQAVKQAQIALWSSPRFSAEIQTPHHNMLELAVYFLGAPYSLDGLGSSGWGDLYGSAEGWVLVGPDPETARVLYPRELALAELKARAGPGVVLFEVDPKGRDGRWRYGESGYTNSAHQLLVLLALLLQGRCDSNLQLQQKLGASDDGALRTARSELRRRLAELTGIDSSRILSSPERGRAPRVLQPTAYGAVPARILRS